MKDDTISRQVAVDTVERMYKACEGSLSDYHDLLVAAFMDLTPAHGDGDTISRAAALSALNGLTEIYLNNLPPTIDRADAVDAIKALPSAQPVVISKSENTTECEDAVSRESVLDEIHRYMEERDYTIGLLHDNVCGLPSVTPKQPGWIPCKTKFPEKDGSYLVTAYNGQMAIYLFVKGMSENYWKQWGATAWCELPSPYRDGGQDEQN